jgi:hypothetical protein
MPVFVKIGFHYKLSLAEPGIFFTGNYLFKSGTNVDNLPPHCAQGQKQCCRAESERYRIAGDESK